MTPYEQVLIDRLFEVRVENNLPWKRIVEIAMTHAPKDTRKAISEITANDRRVSEISAKIAKPK